MIIAEKYDRETSPLWTIKSISKGVLQVWIFVVFNEILNKHAPIATKRVNKGNNKITELRTILQRESQNS